MTGIVASGDKNDASNNAKDAREWGFLMGSGKYNDTPLSLFES
jgi:hypothetical protein